MAVREGSRWDTRPQVGLIVETSFGSGRSILTGIARYARENGPWLLCHEPRGLESAVPGWLKRWQGDGIIARLQDRHIVRAVENVVAKSGTPVVDVLGVARRVGFPLVHVDDAAIGRMAAEHLIGRGFRHFGCCAVKQINWSQQRSDAFSAELAESGDSCSVYLLPERTRSSHVWEGEQRGLGNWIGSLPKPAGILAVSDPVGQRVLEACRRREIALPEEVAVVGVDNDETICEVCDPPLSSVIANHAEVGYEAARLLDELMQGQPAPAKPIYVLPAGVAERLSTDILAIADRDVARALRFIRLHTGEKIDVRDVVSHVPISRTTLKRRFRAILGRSIHEEIMAARIKRVKELLARSDLPLKQIAVKSGFERQDYMGVVFKKVTGTTPAEYRRQERG